MKAKSVLFALNYCGLSDDNALAIAVFRLLPTTVGTCNKMITKNSESFEDVQSTQPEEIRDIVWGINALYWNPARVQ